METMTLAHTVHSIRAEVGDMIEVRLPEDMSELDTYIYRS